MFPIQLTILSIFVFVVQAEKSQQQCTTENERWTCQSSTKKCHRLCENKDYITHHGICTMDCNMACVCQQGFLRQGYDGECVPENQCNDKRTLRKDGSNSGSTSRPYISLALTVTVLLTRFVRMS